MYVSHCSKFNHKLQIDSSILVLQVYARITKPFKAMTLAEKIMADNAQSNVKAVGDFSSAFRSGTREAIKEGETITIPEGGEYIVYENQSLGSEGKHPQYINCVSSQGRIVEFYPSMLTRTAFVVDAQCKPVLEGTRQKRVPTGGAVAKWVAGKEIASTMRAMQGCTLQFHNSKSWNTRAFGVKAEEALPKDVVPMIVGDWDFAGEKRPEGYVE